MENEVKVDEEEVSLPILTEDDGKRYSEQESIGVGDDTDVNEKVPETIEERGCVHVLNSTDYDTSASSIQKVGSGDPNDTNHFNASENVKADMLLLNHSKETETGNPVLLDPKLSPSTVAHLPTNDLPAPKKGVGLKKWRRIKREIVKDASSSLDSTKMLKRGSANILDLKQSNDSSVSSTNAFVKSPGHADQLFHPVQSSNQILGVDATFSAGADDSDDRSSKSSTAASGPKHRYGMASSSGHHQREKHRVKNVSGRQFSSGQRFQSGKGHGVADTSKKPRGESVNLDNENSLSSIESDSRSYISVHVRGNGSVSNDHLQSGRSENFDGEDSYDQQACEVQSAGEHQAGHNRNGDHSPNCSAELSSSNFKGNSKSHQLSPECEPLVNSILMLQSAQEALEREVQMFKELGKGIHSLCDDSGMANGRSNCTFITTPDACVDDTSDSQGSEFKFMDLHKKVQTLERQLDEAKVSLKEKELRAVELEKVINNSESAHVDLRNMMELQHQRCRKMESELEVLFKQNVEAEVQHVVITKSTEDLSVLVEDQIKLLKERYFEATKQAGLLRIVELNGSKIAVSQSQDKLLYSDMEEEIPKMQKRVVKFTKCLFIQLILLALVFRLLMLQLSPKSATVAPT